MARPPQDPEVARALASRARIFAIVEALKRDGVAATVEAIEAAMRRMTDGAFTPADYQWVRTMLGKRR
jgi:hypothetical protein